jgi:hypothetical protein
MASFAINEINALALWADVAKLVDAQDLKSVCVDFHDPNGPLVTASVWPQFHLQHGLISTSVEVLCEQTYVDFGS